MGLLQALNLPPPRRRASPSALAKGGPAGLVVAPHARSATQPAPVANPVVAALAPLGKGSSSAAFPTSLAIHKPGPFEPGTQQHLAVTAIMSDGSVASFANKATWRSSDEALVKMLPGGLAKVGFGRGPVTITAAAPGGKPRASIDVKVLAPLQRIEVTPASPLLEVGQDAEVMAATGFFGDGSSDDIRFEVKWSSDNPKVADFPGQGNGCLGKAKGTATVRATSADGKVSGFTTVTVVAKGKAPTLVDIKIEPLNPEIRHGVPVQFKAIGIYSDKSMHEITGKVDWMSARPEVLSIDSSWGLAKPGLQSGSALITASDPVTHRFMSTTAYVEFPGIRRIELSPRAVEIRAGASASVSVMATLHDGWQMSLNDLVRFTSDKPDVARMTAGGEMVVGEGPGTATIEVFEASTNWTGAIDVTVLPPVLVDVIVEPAGQTILVSQSLPFTATGKFSDGSLVPLVGPTWESSTPDDVDVDQDGVATARQTGSAWIRAVDRDTGMIGSVEVKSAP